jgi:hypothetical protein
LIPDLPGFKNLYGGMPRLIFISHRTGSPRIFVEEHASGSLIRLTGRSNLSE